MDHGATCKKAEGGDLHLTSQGERRRQEALQGVTNGTVYFLELPAELRDDAEIALAAIRERGYLNSQAVSERLKRNKEFVLAAVKVYGWFLQHASEELCGIREIVLEAVRRHGPALRFASEELRNDREVVMAAVQQWGGALEVASEELCGIREIVLAAVRQYGSALQFASEELRADREVVMTVVQNCVMALRFASEELRGNHEIVLEAVRKNGYALCFAARELRADREIVLEAVHNHKTELGDVGELIEETLSYVPNDLQNDPLVAGAIIRSGGRLFRRSDIMERLENVLVSVRALPEAFVENIVDEECVVEFGRHWESSVWHKTWMALELEPPGMEGTGRLFVELSGLPLELRQARELQYCAPVIDAVLSSFPDNDWRDLDSYPARDFDDEDEDDDDY